MLPGSVLPEQGWDAMTSERAATKLGTEGRMPCEAGAPCSCNASSHHLAATLQTANAFPRPQGELVSVRRLINTDPQAMMRRGRACSCLLSPHPAICRKELARELELS